MYTSESFLHFILDDEDDIHFTDSLIAMEAKPFVWYELRRQDVARSILLFELGPEGELRIDVFDTESKKFLLHLRRGQPDEGRRKARANSIDCSTFTLAELQLSEENLLSRLLSAASARPSGRRVALVFTAEAFEQVCRRTDRSGSEWLNRLMDSSPGKCILCIRLPLRADRLQSLLLKDFTDCILLTTVYRQLRTVIEGPREALLNALETLSGIHIFRFDRCPNEMRNLLLRQALTDPEPADTLQQLTEQGAYLEQCRRHGTGLPATDSPEKLRIPRSRRSISEMVRKTGFREALRKEYPAGLQEIPRTQAPFPAFDDELARLVQALELPEECPNKAEWAPIIKEIHRNLTTLWNKPRNPGILQIAAELCRSGRAALGKKNWHSMEEVLVLLDFFAEKVCAPPELDQELTSLWEIGRELIALCDRLYDPPTFGKPDGLLATILMSIEAADKDRLEQMRDGVRMRIAQFDNGETPNIDINKMIDYCWVRPLENIRARQNRHDELRRLEQQYQNDAALTSGIWIDSICAIEPDDSDLHDDLDEN